MPTPEQPVFSGYSPPGSNTTYTPNQFFDVVLPNSSRGVVRIVGFMLRRILGWSDSQGNPVRSQVAFTYSDLIEQANVSRSMIKEALEESIARQFIRCVQEPRAKTAGQNAVSGIYELNWSDEAAYIKDIQHFRGFFSGNGNLTNIPNDFFDYTVREEPLSVVRLVGAIARNTIGFQTHYGFRRQEVQVSLARLHRLTGISSRHLLSESIEESVKRGHIVRVAEGKFELGSKQDGVATVYALRWRDGIPLSRREVIKDDEQKKFAQPRSGRKSPAVGHGTQDIGRRPSSIRKVVPGLGLDNVRSTPDIASISGPKTGGGQATSVRKVAPRNSGHRLENWSQNGLKSEPGSVGKVVSDRLENWSHIEITEQITTNNSSKGAAADRDGSFELLIRAGFDGHAAREMCSRFSEHSIRRQLELLPKRKATKNRLGLLRRAIEEDWPPPRTSTTTDQSHSVQAQQASSQPNEEQDAAFREFRAAEAARLWKTDSKLVDAFEIKDTRIRQTLQTTRMISAEVQDRLLRDFDDEQQRAKRWTQFALDQRRIPTYSAWLIHSGKKAG